MRLWVGILTTTIVLLAGCDLQPGQHPSDDPFGPKGSISQIDAADGLAIGHALMAQGKYNEAYTAYLRAAADQGISVDVLSALGSANLYLGRLGQAEKVLRDAIKQDQTFVPAWNNLGVVLMERGKTAEATRVFKTAFALDSGNSDEIRKNLQRALEKTENPDYTEPKEKQAYDLVRRGNGRYLLLQTR